MKKLRWDRIGMTTLGGLIAILMVLMQNYIALVCVIVATIFMMHYYREQDRCIEAKRIAIGLTEILINEGIFEPIEDGDDDGDAKTYP